MGGKTRVLQDLTMDKPMAYKDWHKYGVETPFHQFGQN